MKALADLLNTRIFIENVETRRYLFADGEPIQGKRGAEGGWLSSSGFQSPNVVGADANYYNRAYWIIRQSGDGFIIENEETKRYLFADGGPIKGQRGAEGGWLSSSGFQSPNVVGADANYYNRAIWLIHKSGDYFIIENKETKRYLFADGPPIKGERGAEGGWLSSSGFESPNVLGADANYYNRALWKITPLAPPKNPGGSTPADNPTKSARGSTPAGHATWQPYEVSKCDQGVFIDIDTSAAGFTETPKYFTALAGEGDLSNVKGIHAIYTPSPTGFRLYLYQPQSQLTPQLANEQKWQIHWMGVAEGVMEAEGPEEQGPEILATGLDNQLWYRTTLTSKWVQVPNSGAVMGVTIMPDGKVLGIGMRHELWYRETLSSNWQHVPNSGAVMAITMLPDGKILGVGMNNHLYTRDSLTSKWQHVPNSGAVMSVTVLPDGKIVGVGMRNQLWYRESLTSGWVNVPNSGAVTSITALPNGKIVGVGMDRQLWYRKTLTSKWVLIPNSGSPGTITYGKANLDDVKQKKPASDLFSTGSKIALQADTGKWFSRCNGCQRTVGNIPDTITVHIDKPESAPYAQFEVVDLGGGKIALKADTGKYVARCRGCIVGGAKPDSVTVHVSDPSAPYAQFTPELLANGKYALKADTGQYVARCQGCSPGAAYRDTVTIHVDDPQSAPYAQWKIIPIS